jgi:hypothetical protein
MPACALAAAPEYRDGWTPANFYSEVAACEVAVTLPAFDGYQKRAAAAGRTGDSLRSETIAMAPVMQAASSRMCFCAFNDLAKDIAFASYAADKRKAQGYVNGHCKDEAQHAMTRQLVDELRLK